MLEMRMIVLIEITNFSLDATGGPAFPRTTNYVYGPKYAVQCRTYMGRE